MDSLGSRKVLKVQFSGFFSYVHDDDSAEGGRIVQLAQDISAQYELLTGDSIELFLDRNSLEWGDAWKDVIDEQLVSVAFFIAVVTPRYFRSPECRRELVAFASRAEENGLDGLFLPVLWVDAPQIGPDSADELANLLSRYQWSNWTGLRFVDRDSSEYRREVARLSQRLVLANEEMLQKSETQEAVKEGDSPPVDSPGFLDDLALMEESIPEIVSILDDSAASILEIAELVANATTEMEKTQNPKFAVATRIRVSKELSVELESPVMEMQKLASNFQIKVNESKRGIDYLLSGISSLSDAELEANEDARAYVRSFLEMINSAAEAGESVQEMRDVAQGIENYSRDLRPVLRCLGDALANYIDTIQLLKSWRVDVEPITSRIEMFETQYQR